MYVFTKKQSFPELSSKCNSYSIDCCVLSDFYSTVLGRGLTSNSSAGLRVLESYFLQGDPLKLG